MDNRIFNINGTSKERLKDVLKLAIDRKCAGWKFIKEKGIVLLWHVDTDAIAFPVPLGVDAVSEIVAEWLSTDQAKQVPLEGWDANTDHDGENELGWRVYCEDWGHVGGDAYAIIAIKPAYMWYGK